MIKLRDFILANKQSFSYMADLKSLNYVLKSRNLTGYKLCLAGLVILLLSNKSFVSSFEELFNTASALLEVSDEDAEFLFFQGNHLKFRNFRAEDYKSDADEVLAKLQLWENQKL